MKKKFLIISGVILVLLIVIWLLIGNPYQEKKPVIVNLQVTEYIDPAALSRVINELETRGIRPATVFIGKEIAEKNCSIVKELDQKGYEIAAFGYAIAENGDFIQLATLSKEEQERTINDTKTAIEDCLNHSINGFRAQRFSKNKETNEIVKDLGFTWHGSFVVNWDPEASLSPYYSTDYGFYLVSIEGVGKTGYVLCDTAMGSFNKTAQEWRQTIQTYFLQHQKEETPFITEFHPYFLTGNSNWWNEFIELLDWLKMQNNNYFTTQQFISHSCLVCGE
jgi:peptidoglycan/xylan/chitin deacetylase (PgdA/CDA1 family)